MTRILRCFARRGNVPPSIVVSLCAVAVILLGIALLVWTAVSGLGLGLRALRPQPVVTSVGPTIEKLEALEELAVQKVTISDVMVYRNGWTATWLVRGDGIISVPLMKSRIVDVDPAGRTARITLPQPRVLSARVDHEKTRYYDSKQGIWNRVNPWGESYPEVAEEAQRQMQRLIEHAVARLENMDQARLTAANVVRALYSGLDWKITVDWEDAATGVNETSPPPDQLLKPAASPPVDAKPKAPT